jgi:hypothetical protein
MLYEKGDITVSSDKPKDTGDKDKENKPPRNPAKRRHILPTGEVPEGKTHQARVQDKLRTMENKLAKKTEDLRIIRILPHDGERIPDIQVMTGRPVNSAILRDQDRWQAKGFPGNKWQTKGYPQREGINVRDLTRYDQLSSFPHQQHTAISNIHSELVELERSERDLIYTERAIIILQHNIAAPTGVTDALVAGNLRDAEINYKTALDAVREKLLPDQARNIDDSQTQ